MRIKMLRTQPGSPDGVEVNVYEAGESYELPDDLAAVFLREDWAEAASEPRKTTKGRKRKAKGPAATKDRGAAPENKTLIEATEPAAAP